MRCTRQEKIRTLLREMKEETIFHRFGCYSSNETIQEAASKLSRTILALSISQLHRRAEICECDHAAISMILRTLPCHSRFPHEMLTTRLLPADEGYSERSFLSRLLFPNGNTLPRWTNARAYAFHVHTRIHGWWSTHLRGNTLRGQPQGRREVRDDARARSLRMDQNGWRHASRLVERTRRRRGEYSLGGR